MSARSPTPKLSPVTLPSSSAPRSVCPSVTMEVTFTGSWYDETAGEGSSQQAYLEGLQAYFTSTLTPWALPQACEDRRRSQRFLQRQHQDRLPRTPSSFPPASTGSSLLRVRDSGRSRTARRSTPTGPARWLTGSVVLTEINETARCCRHHRRLLTKAKANSEEGRAARIRYQHLHG